MLNEEPAIMSEFVTTPGVDTNFPDFGVQVISNQSVTLRRPPTVPGGTVTVAGSLEADIVAPLVPTDPTLFSISGGLGDDALTGAAGDDFIVGDEGADTIVGGEGDDTLYGDAIDAAQTLASGPSGDAISGGLGDDDILGGDGNDTLLGEEGDDTIEGGAGDDVISGGPGKDTLSGGEGKDSFRFETGSTGGRRKGKADVIEDFDSADDLIQLERGLLKDSDLKPGRLKRKDFKAVDELTDDVTQKIIYERSSGLVIYKPVEGANVILLRLEPNIRVTAADFEIF
jgi:Ca2+-binding RTX toxin-like protein